MSIVCGFTFYFEKSSFIVQFVLGHNVNFIFYSSCFNFLQLPKQPFPKWLFRYCKYSVFSCNDVIRALYFCESIASGVSYYEQADG